MLKQTVRTPCQGDQSLHSPSLFKTVSIGKDDCFGQLDLLVIKPNYQDGDLTNSQMIYSEAQSS